VIKRDRNVSFVGWHVARRTSFVIATGALRAIVADDELRALPAPGSAWPPEMILLVRPDPQDLADKPPEEVLRQYWRMLFHARVELELRRRFAEGRIDAAGLRDRIERIGPTAFEEVRTVLRQEGDLLPPRDNESVYCAFAAVYLELLDFRPSLLPHFFPAIEDPAAVAELLSEDVDGPSLLAATRLAGAPNPGTGESTESTRDELDAAVTAQPPRRGARAARRLFHWLILHAERAGMRGNLVRAAFDRARASLLVGPVLAVQARVGARNELGRLVGRLQTALGFDDEEAEAWRQTLLPLLDRAIHGFWTPEGRLLYDLQTVCLDRERQVYTVDLGAWIRSLGRQPLKRSLPHLCEVLVSNRLRSAARRLRAVRTSSVERARLADLIHPAQRRAEQAVRDRFRPLITGVLQTTGIVPHNLPETVAFLKLTEELLDRIVLRGFLSLGDLRDACSRSNLKLPDLSGPAEFLRGDRLLQTDRALGRALEGVYRPGEIYLRALQRLSTLAFATRSGRFLTRYAFMPYGGAFVIVEGLQHLVHPVVHWFTGLDIELMHWASVLYIGTVASGLINSARYRREFVKVLGRLGRSLRVLMIDLPARLLKLPLIRAVLESRPALVLWRFLFKPLFVAIVLGLLAAAAGLPRSEMGAAIVLAFIPSVVVLNTRLGRDAEEILADSAVRVWRELIVDVIPGLFRLILSTFDRILEAVERVLYAVDEWLRFRTGQRRAAIAAKAVLGVGWAVVAYVVRITVNILVEPQVNPIKHFPVVTVSHKVILPLSFPLTRLLKASPLGPQWAPLVAGTIVLLVPGIFGFLVWELKENWRLYEANRGESLGPVVVGDHGETLGRLLRPGIHSGTLPKLFAKLRRSQRPAWSGGDEKGAFKRLETLHHVEDSIRRFIERDFVVLLRESRTLHTAAIDVGAIHLATNRILIELCTETAGRPEGDLWIEFDERHHALIAALDGPGWLPRLDSEQTRVLGMALLGLFKKCGADWIQAMPESRTYNGRGLLEAAVLASGHDEHGLHGGRRLSARPTGSGPGEPGTAVLLPLAGVVVTWRRWVDAWNREQSAARHLPRFLEGYSLFVRTEPVRRRD
jgi:hypothetical protein